MCEKIIYNLTTFFVRPLESTEHSQFDAELNIMMDGNYASINSYAQLVLVAEVRPKQCSLRLRADAASGTTAKYQLLYHQFFHPSADYSHKRLCLTDVGTEAKAALFWTYL